MTDLERKIHGALVNLEESIATMRTAKTKPDFAVMFDHIESLAQQLPASTSRDLLHYLQKKSYQKARLFLEGRDKENHRGGCSRG